MSFGSLSGNAVEALNRGAALAGCLQNTGEGGISPLPPQRRRPHLADRHRLLRLPRRATAGSTSPGSRTRSPPRRCARSRSSSARAPSPASAACCPRAKVTAEIAAIRGVPRGEDCVSPSRHAAFSDVDEMLDFVEMLADATGLPVGIKSAVGDLGFWHELAALMAAHRARASTSSRSTAARAAPARRRWCSPTRWPARSGSASAGSTRSSPRPGCTERRGVHRLRQARAPGERRRRVRARRGPGQRRPRGDAGDRLHPGPEVPHRPLPDRRRRRRTRGSRTGSTPR